MTAVVAQITQSLDGGHVDELVLTIAPVILRGEAVAVGDAPAVPGSSGEPLQVTAQGRGTPSR